MKIRNGFVSNSSSSSFIILGVKSNEQYDGPGIDSIYIEEPDYDYVNGIKIIDSDYFDEIEELSLDTMNEYVEKISTTLNVEKSEIKLIYGCRQC